jgi:hypothetical protein
VRKQVTGEEFTVGECGDLFGVGLMLKAGAMGYPEVVGVRQGSAADAGGVR